MDIVLQVSGLDSETSCKYSDGVYTQLYTQWTVLHVFLVPVKAKQPPAD